MKNELEKVTIYSMSMMGLYLRRARLVQHGRQDYAQYKNVPFVDYIPQGKRRMHRMQESYKPYLVIVKGWDTPAIDSAMTEIVSEGGIRISKSRHSSCDEQWNIEADEFLNKYLAANPDRLIADYREKEESE